MKRTTMVLLAGLTIWCLAGCSMWGEKKNPGWNQATSSEHLERLLWRDISSKNWSAVEKRVAPMAMWSDEAGAAKGRDAVMERLKAMDMGAVQVGEVETAPAGTDMVVTLMLSSQSAGQVRVLDVWQPAGGEWVLIAHSATREK